MGNSLPDLAWTLCVCGDVVWRNTPAVFQAFLNKIFRDLLNVCVIVYLDDILIYSKTMGQHVIQVHKVPSHLLLKKLCQLEKCAFHQTTTTFLEYIICDQGVEMDDNKVKAVTEWPTLFNIKELQHFLGFAHFCQRFIAQLPPPPALLTNI